jgi:hypothetical protein
MFGVISASRHRALQQSRTDRPSASEPRLCGPPCWIDSQAAAASGGRRCHEARSMGQLATLTDCPARDSSPARSGVQLRSYSCRSRGGSCAAVASRWAGASTRTGAGSQLFPRQGVLERLVTRARRGHDLVSGGVNHVPVPAEGVDALAVRVAGLLVAGERVERVPVVGDLRLSVGPHRRRDQ